MNPARPSNRVYAALVVNAAILLLILVALVSRGGRLLAETPVAAGHGLTVMPGQLSPQTWGCYVIDNDNQTLNVYTYSPNKNELRLAAARDIQYDRHLGYYNTSPPPTEVKEMLDRSQEPVRAAPTTAVSPEKP